MPKQIEVEIPEEIHALIESDPFLRLLLEKIVKEEAVNYVLSVLTMDKLTEDSGLTEDDVTRLDTKIKEGIRKRIEDEINR